MALVRAFRALRPKPDLAPQIAAVPYDVVNTEEARALADGNPYSFLHVSRAEIDLPADTNPYADAVYAAAARQFETLRRHAMVEEADPAMYFYRLRMGEHEQTGLAAVYSVDEYLHDIVKKHEKTRPDKEDDRTRHIIELRAQTGPVFLTYRHRAAIDAIAARVCAGAPLYDVVAPDGVGHTLWRCDADAIAALEAEFAALPALYIADGHHRAASAMRACQRFGAGDTTGEHAWFLAVAFPDTEAQILPYNRLVKDLKGRTPAEFLAAVRGLLGREATLDIKAPFGCISGLFRKGIRHILHLMNCHTDKKLLNITVRLRLPKAVKSITMVSPEEGDGKAVPFRSVIGATAFRVPKLTRYQAFVIES